MTKDRDDKGLQSTIIEKWVENEGEENSWEKKGKKRKEIKWGEKKKMERKGEKRTDGKTSVMKSTGAFLSDFSMTQLWAVIVEHKESVCISFLSFALVSSKWESFIPALLIFIIMETSRIWENFKESSWESCRRYY